MAAGAAAAAIAAREADTRVSLTSNFTYLNKTCTLQTAGLAFLLAAVGSCLSHTETACETRN